MDRREFLGNSLANAGGVLLASRGLPTRAAPRRS